VTRRAAAPATGAVAAAACLVTLSLPIGQRPVPGIPASLVQVLAVLPVAVLVLGLLGQPAATRRLPPPGGVLLGGALLVLSGAVSAVAAVDPGTALRLSAAQLLGLGLAVAVAAGCRRAEPARAVACCLCAAGAVLCAAGVLSAGRPVVRYAGALVDDRAAGLFGQPNELGSMAAVVLVLSLGLLLGPAGRATAVLLGVAAALGVAALAASLSRGGWIGALAGVVVLAALATPVARRRLLAALALAVIAAGAAAVAAPGRPLASAVAARAGSVLAAGNNPYDRRPAIWREAARQLADRPVLGSGIGGYPAVAARPGHLGGPDRPEHAHSLPLTIAAEQGMLGLVALSAALALGVAAAREAGRRQAGIGIAAAAALATVVGQGLVDFPLRNPVLGTAGWVLVGLLAGARHHQLDDASTTGERIMTRMRRVGHRAAAATLVAGIAATVVGVRAVPMTYEATSVVSFVPRPDSTASADTVQLVGEKYAVLATAPRTLRAAGEGRAAGDATAALDPGTGNLRITVSDRDPRAAVAAANAIGSVVVRSAGRDPLVDGELVAPAAAAVPAPRRKLLGLAGLAVSVLGVVLVLVVSRRRAEASRGRAYGGFAAPGAGRPREPESRPHAAGLAGLRR
jgi:putative inorganic carbon (hco3(-)) transporter